MGRMSCRRVTPGLREAVPVSLPLLFGCAEPAPALGAGDVIWMELCSKREQGNLSLCEGENVILYLVLLCIFFCKHRTVVGSKNGFSVHGGG